MYWYRQASFWYTLSALFLLSGLLILEHHNQDVASKYKLVRIAADNNENEESHAALEQNIKNINEDHTNLATALVEKRFSVAKKTQLYQNISTDILPVIQLLMGRLYYQKKQYIDVVDVMSPVKDLTRIKHGQQFIYAHSLYQISKTDAAIQAYLTLLKQKPNSQAAALNLAALYRKNNNCKKALPIYLQASKISSGERKAKALAGRGYCLLETHSYSNAVKAFAKSIEYRPNSASTWTALARALYYNNNSYEKVEEAFNRGISLDNSNYRLYNIKARYQIANLDYRGALISLEKSLEINRSYTALLLKSWAYLELGKRNDAKQSLNKAIKKVKTKKAKAKLETIKLYLNKRYNHVIAKTKEKKRQQQNDTAYLLGLSYRKKGLYKKSLTYFEKVKKSNLLAWRIEAQIARILRSRKEYKKAITIYSQLLIRSPKADFLHFEKALTLESLGKFSQASAGISLALKLEPSNLVYQLTQARLLFEQQDHAKAIKTIDTIIEKKPNYIRAWKLKADIYQSLQNTNEQAYCYEKILVLDPQDTVIRYKNARIMVSIRNLKSAESHLRMLLESQNTHQDGRFLLAQVFANTNRRELAINQLQKLLRLTPGHDAAQRLLDSLSH